MQSAEGSKCHRFDPISLYRKYDAELRALARMLRPIFHKMQSKGHGVGIGDVEGELLYLLVRETRPDVVFEISPDCGWSTNYLMAGLTKNAHGMLHSFEIASMKHGEPTETLVRNNLHRDCDQSRFMFHLGDARTTVPTVTGDVQFVFIDSCHEDWFGEWYIKEVFPRVRGTAFVQDIAFIDELERSTEARYVWNWAKANGIGLNIVGSIENDPGLQELRAGYAERRNLRSNSVILKMPPLFDDSFPSLLESPTQVLERASVFCENRQFSKADEAVTAALLMVLGDPQRVNRHRLMIEGGRIGERHEADRAFQRALGIAVQADPNQRLKALSELIDLYVVSRQWRLLAETFFLLAFTPQGPRRLVLKASGLVSNAMRRILPR